LDHVPPIYNIAFSGYGFYDYSPSQTPEVLSISLFNRYNTVDQENATNAMKRLNLFLSEQKSFKSSDYVQTGFY
jgi:hypothetical protein